MFNRGKIASAAQEIADHLALIENVKILQSSQRDLADAVRSLGDRLRSLEADMKVLKAETKFEVLKETQLIVNAVQGGLSRRIDEIASQVGIERRPAGAARLSEPEG